MMAALAGLILTLTLVLAYEYFDDTIRKVTDLAYGVGIPILATIASHKRLQGRGRERFIVHAQPESRAAESYRVLSSKLLISRFQSEVIKATPTHSQSASKAGEQTVANESTLRSVVISGTQPNENVSEIAANLAILLAQTGHRIILVDAYLHQPSIHHLFGIPEQRGLADILLLRNLTPKAMIKQLRNLDTQATGGNGELVLSSNFKADLHETAALVSVEWAPSLQILLSGAQPTNPFELLVSPHMADLIKSLEKQADLVIIAASPLLASADSLILASRTDGVVVVARSGKTRRDTIKEIVEALHSLNANILGAILDQHKRSDSIPVGKRSNGVQPVGKRDRQPRNIVSAKEAV
jgi:Mrp family chromosome partitioning ATPase